MTDDELDAIEARARAATKGPWQIDEMEMYIHGGDGFMVASNCPMDKQWQVRGHGAEVSGKGPRGSQDANAAFIAAARSDIPLLISELRAARERLKAVEAFANQLDKSAVHADEGGWFALAYEGRADALVRDLAADLKSALRGSK